MKTLLLMLAIIIAVATTGKAQIANGRNHVGGSISYESYKTELENSNGTSTSSITNTGFTVLPSYGYFVGEKTELGINIGYQTLSGETNSSPYISANSKTSEEDLIAGPYVKFYQNISEKFYFNFSIGANYVGGSKTTRDTYNYNVGETKYSISGWTANLNPGFSYFLNQHWGVGIGLGSLYYESQVVENKTTKAKDTTTRFNFQFNLASLSFGTGYYF